MIRAQRSLEAEWRAREGLSLLDQVSGVLKTACLIYVLWLPVSRGDVLYPVLALLAAVSAFDVLRTPPRLERSFVLGVSTLIGVIALGLTVGAVRDVPGTVHQAIVWLGSMTIWGLWALSLRRAQLKLVFHAIVFVVGLNSLLMVVYIGGELGYLPAVIPEAVMEGQGAGIGTDPTGATAIRFHSLSTLAAGVPLLVAMAVSPRNELFPSRWVLAVCAVLAMVAVTLSGRRAILAVALLAPVIYAVLEVRFRRIPWGRVATHRATVPTLLSAAGVVALALTLSGSLRARLRQLWADTVASYLGIGSVDVVAGSDNRDRVEQTGHLLAAWVDRPLFGHGIGAVVKDGYYRSQERPWMFELQYHLWLFNAGIVGVAIGAAALLLLARSVRRTARVVDAATRGALATSATAALCLLIANATNPYLQAVGHWWGVTLVFGIAVAAWNSRPPEGAGPQGRPEAGTIPLDAEGAGVVRRAVRPVAP